MRKFVAILIVIGLSVLRLVAVQAQNSGAYIQINNGQINVTSGERPQCNSAIALKKLLKM